MSSWILMYHSTSADIFHKNLKFKLSVHRYTNKELHAYLTHVNEDTNKEYPTDSLDSVSCSYSLHLRSFNPFKDSFTVEKTKGQYTLSDKTKICSHLSSFPSQNQRVSNRCRYSCAPEFVVIASKMSELFFNQREFIKNFSFKLEAFVEFTD